MRSPLALAILAFVILAFGLLAAAARPASAAMPAGCPLSTADVGHDVDKTFTDDTGRTLRFRFAFPSGANPAALTGVLIYFHGNEADAGGSYFPSLDLVRSLATARGLIPVVALAPDTYMDSNQVVRRTWLSSGLTLVKEWVTASFGGCINLDKTRVFLAGESEGTCLISYALVTWLPRGFAGGALGLCGCWNTRDQDLDVGALRSRFKVFVQGTMGDFLFPYQQAGYDILKYNLYADVRGDLGRAGDHCVADRQNADAALDWLVSGTAYPDSPLTSGYWQQVDTRSNEGTAIATNASGRFVAAVARLSLPDADRQLIVERRNELPQADFTTWLNATYPNYGYDFQTYVQASDDYGATWTDVASLPVYTSNLDAVLTSSGTFFLGGSAGLFRLDAGATTLVPAGLASELVLGLERDDTDRLFAYGQQSGLMRSSDGGASWQSLGVAADSLGTFNPAHVLTLNGGHLVVARAGGALLDSTDGGAHFTARAAPAALSDLVHAGAWFYGAASASSAAIYVSSDAGASWTSVPAPDVVAALDVTGSGDLLMQSTSRLGYRSRERGQSWAVEPGLHDVANYGTSAFAPNGHAMVASWRGILRLYTSDLPRHFDGGTGGASGSGGAGGTTMSGTGGAGGATVIGTGGATVSGTGGATVNGTGGAGAGTGGSGADASADKGTGGAGGRGSGGGCSCSSAPTGAPRQAAGAIAIIVAAALIARRAPRRRKVSKGHPTSPPRRG
jgi:MYXO-CTERM domain-containing protein